eukprot:TRINITY_DN11895_c0_g1_i4.p1 TRINITY_DN11895_c0_g1~~TRINITY_DN11895_c0_g1_i4.p1  ORF type:complete len:430 (+),score=122.84 TRINITY_DN11895_c0_g1_i4:65-1354(+)
MAPSEDVLLGYVGRRLGEELDIRISRIGGAAVWSKAPSPKSCVRRPDFLSCKNCNKPLALLTQISAAYGDRPRRLLHVFACRNSSCGSKPNSWRVLRSTGQLESPEEAKHQEHAALPVASNSSSGGYGAEAVTSEDWGAPAGDDWGVPSDDWAAPMSGSAAGDADAEIEALLAGRSAAAPSVAKAPKSRKPLAEAAAPEDDSLWMGVTSDALERGDAWPCLALTIDYEPWAADSDKPGDHEQELLQKYLASELAEGEVEQLTASGALPKELEVEVASHAASNLQKEAAVDASADHEVAFGEDEEDDEDEEEAVLAGGGGGSSAGWLRRFQKRISRSPLQVIRYCWGGSPVWLQAPPSEVLQGSWPPRCSCGAARCFELQLLPTLHCQLVDAEPSEDLLMDWGTVMVYTCSKDCQTDDPCEEFLVVQPAL